MENETTIIDAEQEILDDGDTCTVIDDTLCYDNIVLVPTVKYYLYETRYLLLLPFFTSSTFMIPFIWVLYTYHYLPVPTFIMCVVIFETIVSLLFWYDPIKNQATNIHKIDGIFARISICTMVAYHIFCTDEFNYMFWFCLVNMVVFFTLSNYFYREGKWCTPLHIMSHCFAHIYATMCIFFTIKHKLHTY